MVDLAQLSSPGYMRVLLARLFILLGGVASLVGILSKNSGWVVLTVQDSVTLECGWESCNIKLGAPWFPLLLAHDEHGGLTPALRWSVHTANRATNQLSNVGPNGYAHNRDSNYGYAHGSADCHSDAATHPCAHNGHAHHCSANGGPNCSSNRGANSNRISDERAVIAAHGRPLRWANGGTHWAVGKPNSGAHGANRDAHSRAVFESICSSNRSADRSGQACRRWR
jgi:hypothetical protein